MNRIFKATISIATLHFIANQRGFDFTMIVSLGKNDNLIGICCHRPLHHSPLGSFPLCVGGWGGGWAELSAWDADLYRGIWQAVNNFNWVFHTENEHFYLFVHHCPNNPSFDSRFVSRPGSWCILSILSTPEWAYDRLRRLHSPLIITLPSQGSQLSTSKWSLPLSLSVASKLILFDQRSSSHFDWSPPIKTRLLKRNQIVLFLMIYCNKANANKAHALQIHAHYWLAAAPSCLFVSTCEHNSYPFASLSLSDFICKHLWLRIKAIVKF